MWRRAEHGWVRVLAAYAAFAAGLALVVVPVSVSLAPSSRPAVIRLAVAALVGVALVHRVRTLRASIDTEPPSEFERALVAPRPPARLAPSLVRLRDEIGHSTGSLRYFEHVLWPRLLALRGGSGGRGGAEATAPPAGRWPRRGPSLSTLRELIAEIERHTWPA